MKTIELSIDQLKVLERILDDYKSNMVYDITDPHQADSQIALHEIYVKVLKSLKD